MAKKKVEDELAGLIIEEAKKVAHEHDYIKCAVRTVSLTLPSEIRLGQAIVNAMTKRYKDNPSIPEDVLTALYYIDDKALGEAVSETIRPNGFKLL